MTGKNCKLLVVCGPSGSGKSSLIQRLFKDFPDKFGFSISHTTRNPRPGEKDGVDYYFTSKNEIEKGIIAGKFLETAVFSGNTYGTSFESVEKVCESGKVCILDIEVEGVKQVKEKNLDTVFVFVRPPSMEILEARLRGRGTETEESLAKRLDRAKKEIEFGLIEGNFDTTIVNDRLEDSYTNFKSFVVKKLIYDINMDVCEKVHGFRKDILEHYTDALLLTR